MAVLLILLALGLLIAGAWAGLSVLVLAPLLAGLAAIGGGRARACGLYAGLHGRGRAGSWCRSFRFSCWGRCSAR
jgi:hypothetical protein